MTQQNLINSIKREAKKAGLDDCVLPAPTFLEKEEKEIKASIRHSNRRIGGLKTGVNKRDTSLKRKISRLTRKKERLEAEYEEALHIERDSLDDQISNLETQIEEASDEQVKNSSPITKLQKAVDRLKKRLNDQVKTTTEIQKLFPNTKVLDLNCLNALKRKDGLPAFTLFETGSRTSSILISKKGQGKLTTSWANGCKKGSYVIKDAGPGRHPHAVYETVWESNRTVDPRNEFILPRDVLRTLGKDIQAAVGLKLSDFEFNRTAQKGILLDTTFKPRNGTSIPKRTRDIIRKAEESRFFDQIALLTRVRKWDIEYIGRPNKKPKISNKAKAAKSSPLLVIGIKKFGYRVDAFLLGTSNKS